MSIYTFRVDVTDSINLTTGLIGAYTYAGLGTSLESKSISGLTIVPTIDIEAQENIRLRAADITTSGFNLYGDPLGDPPPYTDVQIFIHTYDTTPSSSATTASTTVKKPFFWYVRASGRTWVLGIVDKNGDAIADADLTIEYSYQEMPDDISADTDNIPIPTECQHGFLMGVAYEVMRMMGKLPSDRRRTRDGRLMNSYQADFEDAIYDAIHMQIEETQQPLRIAPIDIRQDQQRIRTRTRDA